MPGKRDRSKYFERRRNCLAERSAQVKQQSQATNKAGAEGASHQHLRRHHSWLLGNYQAHGMPRPLQQAEQQLWVPSPPHRGDRGVGELHTPHSERWAQAVGSTLVPVASDSSDDFWLVLSPPSWVRASLLAALVQPWGQASSSGTRLPARSQGHM